MRLSKEELLENIMNSFQDLSKGSLNNAISAMINMFDNSSLNDAFNLGILEKKGRATKFIDKDGVNDELDMLLVAYALYKVKENKTRNDFTVSELFDENFEGGPYKLFGVSQSLLEKNLRGLNQLDENILKADLAADLDNIFLSDNILLDDIIRFKKEVI